MQRESMAASWAFNPGTPEQADEWMALGFNVISWSSDIAVYRASLDAGVKRLRERSARA